ncbi:hypothetical protein Mal52_56180 [Symmachiella dynata]|uniref:Uncharacterized protein n=1 Tax=Symmachiella dynata TaxID=2527995 RepID=A0A517ZXA8_9PLAN|nr:hypothetical protein Mal52_56180 [Symmachiella dynata]
MRGALRLTFPRLASLGPCSIAGLDLRVRHVERITVGKQLAIRMVRRVHLSCETLTPALSQREREKKMPPLSLWERGRG